MNAQRNLFEGRQRKERGIRLAARKYDSALSAAQAWAKVLGRNGASVTIEDVKRKLAEHGVSELHNAAGAVFRTGEWECVGYALAERPSRHAGINRVWRLKRP